MFVDSVEGRVIAELSGYAMANYRLLEYPGMIRIILKLFDGWKASPKSG
jgi:hypothetical protein